MIVSFTQDGKYNRATIMAKAHKLVREENPILIERVGYRKVLGWKLKTAWESARYEKRFSTFEEKPPVIESDPKIIHLQEQIVALKYRSFRYDIGAEQRKLESQIAELRRAA